MKKLFILLAIIVPVAIYGQTAAYQWFEPAQIKADIDTLMSRLIDTHPTFQDHYKANNVQRLIDRIKSGIDHPMTDLEFFRLMQPIVAIDGHTTLRYTGALCPDEDHPLFPFKVIIFNNALYIKENLSKNTELVKGTVIEKINGIAVELIINKLISYVPGEKESYKTKKLEQSFHIFLALVYGSFSDFTITVNNSELTLSGAAWNDFQEESEPKFELRYYDDDIAYLYKRMFMPPRDFLHFIDSAFAVISKKKIKHLIIENKSGGGLTDLADSLMAYFTDKPFRMLEKQLTRISPLTKDFIESKKTEGVVENGYFIQEYAEHPSTRKNRFTGSTYLLTGPLSYSTATSFAAAAKHYHNALLVGEETGQPLVSNGGQNQFVLPETGMSCITSISIVYMPGSNNDQINGVFPDYKVTPAVDDLLYDKNYRLEYTLDLIRKNKLKAQKRGITQN